MKLLLAVFCLFINLQVEIELEKRSLLSNKIEMLVPKDFKEMSKEMIAFKYQGNNKPTFVLTNKEATVNIAMNILEGSPADSSVIENYETAVKNSFKNSFPDARWIDDGITTVNGKKTGYLKLITKALDQPIYNCLFITDIDGKLFICTFNCIEKVLPEWKYAADKMAGSFVVK